MNNKKILIVLSVIALTLLFVGAVSAADNTTKDTVKIKEKENTNKEVISETQIQSTKNKEISNVNTNKVPSNSTKSKDNIKPMHTNYSKSNNLNSEKTIVSAPKVYVYYKHNNYFKVEVKNSHKKLIPNLKLKLRVYTGKTFKTYTIKTNKKGIASLNTKNLKIGIHNVLITSGSKKYKVNKASKIIVKKYQKLKTLTMKIGSGDYYEAQKRVYKKDYINLCYESKWGRQSRPGISIYATWGKALNTAKHIKVSHFITYYKNYNGKIINRKSHYHAPQINGYKPFQVKIWYKIFKY